LLGFYYSPWLTMCKSWTCSWICVSSIVISPTLGYKNVFGKCYLKVSCGITIWTSSTKIGSLGTCSINPISTNGV